MPAIRETDGDEDQDESQHGSENVEVEREAPVERAEDEVDIVVASDEDDGDERVASSNDEEDERPQRRERETAKQRRERARLAKQRDKMELDFQKREMDRLQRTVEELTRSQVGTRVTELDNRINSANAEVDQWERVQAAAIAKNNGADSVAAQKLREEAIRKRDQANWEKNNLIQAARQPVNKEPAYAPLAHQFMRDNPWYDHGGGDEDSLIVKAIDAAVAKQYRPEDPAYWNELQKRVDARLGNKKRTQSRQDDTSDDSYEDEEVEEQEAPRTRRGPPTGGSSRGNSSTRGGGRDTIRLSPDRVQAMKDAGIWEDPVARQRMAKKYAEYDRNNRNG